MGAKVLWSLGSISTDFLRLETRLDSLALAKLVLVAVGPTLRVLGHQFQSCKSALATWSQFRDQSDLVLDINILLAVFTADSALRLE